MTTKTCTNGHTMTGIGFNECPECEAPWKSPKKIENKLHTTTSAGRLVGVSRQAIVKAIKTGRLHAQIAGGTVFVIYERDLLSTYYHNTLKRALSPNNN